MKLRPRPFSNISDFMERYYNDGTTGARPGSEYRPALRNQARIAYRLGKKLFKEQSLKNKDITQQND